jgi:hypothetical protein
VLWQVYGNIGLVRSVAKGWKWFKGLLRGPVKKMAGVPRPRLEMVAPAAVEQPAAPAPAEQLV